jgi:hypothetical protein
MTSHIEHGKVKIEIDGIPLSVGYEMSNFREHEFDLVVWYCGIAIKDRVRWETFDPHDQIDVFARMLVERHLSTDAS